MATLAGRATPQPPYPIDPAIEQKLDPEYANFYHNRLEGAQQIQYQPIWKSRSTAPVPGAGPMQPVGAARDYKIQRRETAGPEIPIRVFTPEGQTPKAGWPVMLWLHGGGWVLGGIDTENVVCTNMCNKSRSVVITADYRLAPEHPFPAALDDAWETLLFLSQPPHASGTNPVLALNSSLLSVGGSSAGGNLALTLAQRALSPPNPLPNPIRINLVALSVPVTDNTANPHNNPSWRAFEHTPALPAEKMLWYREKYLPDERDCWNSEASPLWWEGQWGKLPRTVVLVGELDVLRAEGELVAKKMEDEGGDVRLEIMTGMPHPFIAMDGVLEKGKQAIDIFCAELEKVSEMNAEELPASI